MKSLIAIGLSVPLLASAQSHLSPTQESVVDRFLRYVKIDTQSREDQKTVPSTESERAFAEMLAQELEALGVDRVRVSEHVACAIPAVRAARLDALVALGDT